MHFQIASQPAKISSKGGLNLFSIEKRLWKLLNDAPNSSVFKIFLYIALNQPDEGIRGYRTTKIQLGYDLNLKKSVVFRDLKWLKDNLLIQELKLVEDFDFMVNPYLVMNNSNRDERIAEWARRQHLDSAREQRLRKEKRLRELRNTKKSNK